MRARIALLATVLLFLSALPALLCFRSLLREGDLIGPRGEDPFLALFQLEWGAERWAEGLDSYWDAPFFFPSRHPIALSDHFLLPAALHGALRWSGLSPAATYDTLLVASFSLTCVALFLLLHRATRAPAMLVGLLALAVTYAPWRWGQLTHLAVLWAPGPPLALLAVDRLLRKPAAGRAVLFLLAFAIACLSGAYLFCFTGVALGFVAVARLLHRPSRSRIARSLPLLLATAACALALTAAVYLPYRDVQERVSAERREREVHQYGARATDWWSVPNASRYASFSPPEWSRPEGSLFPGWLLSVGLLAALLPSPRRRLARLPLLGRGLLAGGLFFLASTNAAIFLALAKVLPGWSGMRVPMRAQFFVLVGIAVVAAAAGHALVRSLRSGRLRGLLIAGAACLLIPELLVRPLPVEAGFRPAPRGSLSPVERRLMEPDVSALAIFPLGGSSGDIPRMWKALDHRKPIVNGYSGELPAEFRFLRRACAYPRRRIRPECVAAMKELGLSHFIVEERITATDGAGSDGRIARAIREDALRTVTLVRADESALLFALN